MSFPILSTFYDMLPAIHDAVQKPGNVEVYQDAITFGD
jgi:hypothetical protein